jgi:hypothetical protein
MSYTKTNWINGETPINATNLNNIENGIKVNANNIENLKGYILYENVEGSKETITLNETSSNFKYIEIYSGEHKKITLGVARR